MNDLWQFIKECVQLLYWNYFKPFTLAQKLKEIDPDLPVNSNPCTFDSKFLENPKMKRYADRIYWLTVVSPIVGTLVAALIYSFFSKSVFEFGKSGFFYVGWWLTCSLISESNRKWFDRLIKLVWILFGLFFGCMLLWSIFQSIGDSIYVSILSLTKRVMILDSFLRSFTYLFPSLLLGFFFGLFSQFSRDGFFLCVVCCALLGMNTDMPYSFFIDAIDKIFLSIALNALIRNGFFVIDTIFGISFSTFIIVSTGVISILSGGFVFGIAMISGALRIYFWIPELLWTIGLAFLTGPTNAAAALRYLPPYYDQTIYFPIPFMSSLIAEAHRTDPLRTQATLDHFTNFTNQQRTVTRTLERIAVYELDACRHLSDITTLPTRLPEIPRSEKDFGPVLHQLLDQIPSLNAVNAGTSPVRKVELLSEPIASLQKLQRTLATRELAKYATLYGPITDRWLRLLQDHQRTLQLEADNSPEIQNPYLTGNALKPITAQERYKGRRDLFRAIEEIVLSHQPPVLNLYGRRRTGNTSNLQYLPDRVGGNIIPLFVDLQGISAIESLSGAIGEIAQAIRSSARTARQIDLPPFQLTNPQEPLTDLRNWIQQVEKRIPDKRFLLCLDEFERLDKTFTANNNDTRFLDFLRNLIQHNPRWILLISGSHRLQELPTHWSDCFISTKTLRMTYLQDSEARELIQKPIATFPDIYQPDAIDAIVHLTRCQPFLIQLTCRYLVDRLNAHYRQTQTTRQATVQDLEAIVPDILEGGDGYFTEFWKTLTPPQQRVLHTIANRQPLPPDTQRATLTNLITAEILELHNDQYRYQVPLLDRYVQTIELADPG